MRPASSLLAAATAAVLSSAFACGRDLDVVGPPEPPPGPAVRIGVTPQYVNLVVGRFTILSATTYDERNHVTPSSIAWSSADPRIATVGRDNGRLTAISEGSTTITATAGTLNATVTVNTFELSGTLAVARLSYGHGDSHIGVVAYDLGRGDTPSIPNSPQFPSLTAPAWSPDGTLLAIEGIKGPIAWDDTDNPYYLSDLYVVNLTSSSAPWRALTANDSSRSPGWSPNGTRIAFVKGLPLANSHIYIVGASGGATTRLTSQAGFYDTPRWSPDGQRLAFSCGRDICISNADGSEWINVTKGSGWFADPSWSPDGTQLVYVGYVGTDDAHTDLVIAAVNDLEHPVFFGSRTGVHVRGPVWSPAGHLLAVSIVELGNHAGVYVIDPARGLEVEIEGTPVGSWDRPFAWKR